MKIDIQAVKPYSNEWRCIVEKTAKGSTAWIRKVNLTAAEDPQLAKQLIQERQKRTTTLTVDDASTTKNKGQINTKFLVLLSICTAISTFIISKLAKNYFNRKQNI